MDPTERAFKMLQMGWTLEDLAAAAARLRQATDRAALAMTSFAWELEVAQGASILERLDRA